MSIEGTLRVGQITDYPSAAASRTHCRVTVFFPDGTQKQSNTIPASESFDFAFESTFNIDTSSPNSFDMLVSEPLKVILASVSADARHQTNAFEFQLYLDQLLTQRKTSIAADVIGKHCEESEFDASIAAPSLKLSFEIPEPLLPQEDSEGSTIMRLKAEELKTLPTAVLMSTLHQDDQVHPFDYNVAFRFPCGRIIQLPAGHFQFSDPPLIKWDGVSRVFLPVSSVKAMLEENAVVNFEIWREINEDYSNFQIPDNITNAVAGRGSFPAADFTKPGQSHYYSDIPITNTDNSDPIRGPDNSAASEDNDPKNKGKGRKVSSRSSKRKPKHPITAKDKKQLKVMTTAFQDTPPTGFDGTTTLSVDIQFSHALILKPLVPHPTIKPSDLVHRPAETRMHHLEEATIEYRQAVQRLANEIIAAQAERRECQLAVPDFPDDLMPLLVKLPSYHVALEKLRIAISMTFAEFSLAHDAQSESQMQSLQNELPFYLRDELVKQLPDFFIKSKQPPDLGDFLRREAEEAELMDRPEAASEMLEELIALDLTNADSWWLYGRLMLKHGDLTRAEECVRRGLTCDPNHIKLSILFASLLTRQEKYFDAIDFLKAAHFKDRKVEVVLSILNGLANIPNPKPTLEEGETPLQFAHEFMDMMDVVFAEQLIAQEQMKSGETLEVLLAFGRLHYLLHDFSKSVSFLTRAVGVEKTADGLLLLGHVEFERKRYQESAEWFEEGLELQFEQKAALRLGFIYLKLGDYLKAESFLFQCSPQSASLLLGLGIAAFKLEKYKQADEFLNRASAINFRHPDIWANLALFSLKMERQEEAEHAAMMAIKWNLRDEGLKKELIDAGLVKPKDDDKDNEEEEEKQKEEEIEKENSVDNVDNDDSVKHADDEVNDIDNVEQDDQTEEESAADL